MTPAAPRLIVFAGPACSGKSTLAQSLSRQLGVQHLEMDRTRTRLMPASPHTRADRAIAYRAMIFAAELLLERGQSVLLDAPYGHPEDRRDVAEAAARTGAALFLIECRVPPGAAALRFRQRDPRHPGRDLTEDRVADLARAYPYSGKGLLIDTALRGVEESLRLIAEYLARGEPVPPREWGG